MTVLVLPASSGISPRYFTYLTAAMAVLTLVYVLYLAARWTGYWNGEMEWADEPGSRTVFVGGQAFEVPVNMIRTPAHRLGVKQPGEHLSTLHLGVLWPSMSGFEKNKADQFAAFGEGSNVVLLDIGRNARGETMRDRLDPVYRRLARGKEGTGPAGLKVLTLSSPIGARDQIVYEPGSETGFIARCRQSLSSTIAICTAQRELSDGLLLTYRFEEALLANWGRLERRAVELVRTLEIGKN
ncbi:hypothetical protein [uncultured Roseibium sp.]|uniref:hypothetical protein n=1 Tax=uncultured Roseibium sp. TaxID=1936171 RepID=UPI003216AEAB